MEIARSVLKQMMDDDQVQFNYPASLGDTVHPEFYTSGLFDECPPTGTGPGADAYLCQLKNRDREPPYGNYQWTTIDDLKMWFPPDLLNARDRMRKDWTLEERFAAYEMENKGMYLGGYLLDIIDEAPEPCKCDNANNRSILLSLVERPIETSDLSVICAVTPRMIRRHPNWEHLDKYIGKPLRVFGWVLWDSHRWSALLDGAQSTLWEIYPITRIETLVDGVWQPIP